MNFRHISSNVASVVALLLGVAVSAVCQPNTLDSIKVGGQLLHVGMSKNDAMEKLSLCCKLSGHDDSFFIQSKEKPYDIYGSIRFTENKVAMVTRDIDQFQEAPSVKLAQAIYREIAALEPANGRTVTVQTSEVEGKDLTIRYVSLIFPNGRSIVIEINKVDSTSSRVTDWVDLKEYLEKH